MGIICYWEQEPEDIFTYENSWATSCGEQFILNEGTPKENSMKHCPYCGGELNEREWTYET